MLKTNLFWNTKKHETRKLALREKKKKATHPQNIILSFLLVCNVIIRVKDIKVVQFKRKFHYIIPGKEFFTTPKKIDKIRFKSKSLMLRKRNITMKIIINLFQNIFNDSPSPFSLTFFFFLATAWTNILFYCFDLYQVQFQISKANSSIFCCHIKIILENKW